MHKTDRNFVIGVCAAIAVVIGVPVYESTLPTTSTYITDITLGGDAVIERVDHSAWFGFTSYHRLGYFGGGNPAFVGFGCDDHSQPVIAISEDDLSHCERVEPIANHRDYLDVAN